MKIDDEKDVKVKFPDEYFSKDLAGKDATFKVKLHDIKKKELPELDDEFAKDVSEFDTLEELKKSIKEKLTKNKISRRAFRLRVIAIVSLVFAAGVTSVMVPLISSNSSTNQRLEMEIHNIDSDITKLNNQMKD